MLLLDGGTPKVPPAELRRVVHQAGMEVGSRKCDFGIVVGGDGRFSWYGRTVDVPLLFVGVRSRDATGSRAYLARTSFDELPGALAKIQAGKHKIEEHRRLGVLKDGKQVGEVFTDVYLQRGSDGHALRYKVRVSGPNVAIEEAAISDGVVVTTSAGSTGYYSYIDRLRGESMDPTAFATVGKDMVGVCHITPTYTERKGSGAHPLRYVVPWGSTVDLSLFRDADARLYGVTDSRSGIRVSLGDVITIIPGKKTTRVIAF